MMNFRNKKALLMDMNSTFMFGEDRFGKSEDFSKHYRKIGGTLESNQINQIIRLVYKYLDVRYPDEEYRHNFPTVKEAINEVLEFDIGVTEMKNIVDTFSFHEIGHIPDEYKQALYKLQEKYKIAVVIDIWSPKDTWLELFNELGLSKIFTAMSFSSDHGMVKPSPEPFQNVLKELGVLNSEALVIGDSPRRDLGGANAAGIDCVLVGGANHPDAIACYNNLLGFSHVA